MPRYSLRLPSICFLALLLVACGADPKHVSAQSGPQIPQLNPLPHTREADDAARFFAGMPSKPGSSFADLESTPVWQAHKVELDHAWERAKVQLLDNLHAFEEQELKPIGLEHRVVYYPFSGPDSLTATQYFPHSPLYVMVALEPPGTVPNRNLVDHKELPGYLSSIRSTTADILGRSFFVTRQMDKQLRGQVTDGTILPILHLLVRTGYDILGFRYIRVDENGQIVDRPASYQTEQRHANRGIEIEFQSSPDAPSQHLYYFSVNVDDAHLKSNTSFQTYLKTLHDTSSMLKATSYMLHSDGFSTIRNQILESSAAVIQDDSGLPFHFYTANHWNVQLYGEYTKPYGSFAYHEQKDLREAYQKGAKPLPLHIGYGYRRVNSNLQLATRAPLATSLPGAAK